MRSNYYQHKQRSNKAYRPHGGDQSYVWRVRWWNMNVKNGAYQYKSFRSKTQALMFRDKLKCNPNNNVSSYLEKIEE